MATTKYVWDVVNDTVLMETDGSNTTQAVYHSDPVPYSRLFSMRRRGKTYSYHYDAWGNPTAHTGTTKNSDCFGGRHGYQYDEATADYCVRARTNEPKQSRWTSRDPGYFTDVNVLGLHQ